MHVAINAIPLTKGGGLTGLVGYLQAFQRHEPTLRFTVFASRSETVDAVQKCGLEVCRCGSGESFSTRLFAQLFLLGPALSRNQCDLVLTTNASIPRCRIPQVVHHRNPWCFDSPLDRSKPEAGAFKLTMIRYAAKRALCDAAANVFHTHYLRNAAERIDPRSKHKNHIIPNGLDARFSADAMRGVNAWGGEPLLCSVSYANRQKNNETAVRALAELVRRQPEVPWRLEFTGAGRWDSIQQLAGALGVGHRVKIKGYLTREELISLYRRSLCTLFTSYFESFGNPPIEAMSQGCPVIASNATSIPEVVGDAGILVDPQNHSGFADAILGLWRNLELRRHLIYQGHKRAQLFTWASSVQRLAQVFRIVLVKGGS